MKGGIRIPLLAVDGGGTKCRVVFTNSEGSLLGEGTGGSCNYQGVGREGAVKGLSDGLHEAIQNWVQRRNQEGLAQVKAAAIEVDCAVFALAGLDTEQDRSVIAEIVNEALLQQYIRVKKLVIENDGFSALLGAAAGSPGILVISGTGSIVYGVNELGVLARAGGWGHLAGDEGSGYWIGSQAVTAILRAYDGRGEPTELGRWMFPQLGFNHPEDLFNWMYSPDYSVEKLSGLSRFVSMAAAAGDATALTIVTAASDELFAAVRSVIDRLHMRDSPFKLILQGGVLQNDAWLRQALLERIEAYAPEAQLEAVLKEPIQSVTAMGLTLLTRELKRDE